MSDDEYRPAWAEEIRAKREGLCWTQKELARQLKLAADSKTRARLPSPASIIREIRFHESGTHHPGPMYAELYRRVWAKHAALNETEAELGKDPLLLSWTVGRLSQRVDRRTLLQLAAATTANAVLDPAERLIRALVGDHRPDEVTVTHLEDRTKGFHRLEEHLPAKTLHPALMTHLGEVSALLESGPPEHLRRRLAVIAGEGAILAAWYAWELGDGPQMAISSRLVNLAARHSGDNALAACMTGYRTYMTGGDNAHGSRLAATALERLGNADLATRAWLLARHAEEAALLGDHQSALKSIHRAEEAYDGADINARPWTCFLDPGRFASMTLSVYSRLRREEDAIRAADEIIMHLGPNTEIKKLCVVKADLALARLRLGDMSQAVKYARTSLSATSAMAFPLGWDRLDHVVAELAPSRTQVAREFRTEYAAMRPKQVQSSLQ
ncbi:XRE family transcriptional regulator (plasmid) [Streptosporangium sp. CA-135522]|uniref:XRE family transcriptional regulator n=1 Tax=Streptosporangium sp. CA-135522 TaxID=3240072 RepID=UPI003D8FAC70